MPQQFFPRKHHETAEKNNLYSRTRKASGRQPSRSMFAPANSTTFTPANTTSGTNSRSTNDFMHTILLCIGIAGAAVIAGLGLCLTLKLMQKRDQQASVNHSEVDLNATEQTPVYPHPRY